MAATLTANEEAQLLQTIEMFEVITQSQPLDYQSLEILKEAYSKLGRESDVVVTSKRIAEAYVQLGQLSSAILEYESVLQRSPDDPDVQKALAEIANKANSLASPVASPSDSEFIEKQSASAAIRKAAEDDQAGVPTEVDDGKQQMHKIFVESKLIAASDFDQLWPKVSMRDMPRQPGEPFIQTLSDRQVIPLEKSLKLLCEKSRLSYLPMEKYDVDIEFARTLPKESCFRWSVLPFDRMSKSILVATCNPFNKQAIRELEQYSKSRVIWYLAPPAEMVKIIKKVFR
jgi:tetratricopeptide (TPR) repeat protein